jgi:predicted unusual protein kinase regulating ubiquinone biosynthesis (AarF/ABC1/UbiB family)
MLSRRSIAPRASAAAAPTASATPSKNTPLRIARFFAEAQIRARFLQADQPAALGAWARQEMMTLGPAYIKLGQALSTRTDLLDKSIIAELSRLQDNNDPAPFGDIRDIIEASLGRPLSAVFSEFQEVPLASASIGQVHRARLRDGGAEVAVKAIKPNVARQIRDDLAIIKSLNDIFVRLGFGRAAETESFISQYETYLSAELDYNKERDNMERFRASMEDMPVIVPKVYAELSTDSVLTMEYVPGIKITDIEALRARGYDTTLIAENLVSIFLTSIIRHGFSHGDAHPGNIAVSYDGDDTIILYDFAVMVSLSKEFRGELSNMIVAMYQRDATELVEVLMRLNILQVSGDAELADVIQFFNAFLGYLDTLDINALKQNIIAQAESGSEVPGAAGSAAAGGAAAAAGAAGGADTRLRINPDFLGIIRVFSLLDGTCGKLDKNFSYINALSPFVESIMMSPTFYDYRARRDIQKLQRYPRIIQATDQNVARLDRRVKNMSANQSTVQYLIIAAMIVQNISEPAALWPLAPILAYYLYTTRR